MRQSFGPGTPIDSAKRAHHGVLCALLVALFASLAAGCDPESSLNGPTQAVVGPDGRLYVADGYFNARIAVFTIEGEFVDSWGSEGFGRGQLNTPHGLVFDGQGALLVADRGNGRVQRFNIGGQYLGQWIDPDMGRPWSIALAPSGDVYVVDGGDQDADEPRAGLVQLTAEGEVTCRWSGYGDSPGLLDEGHMIAVSESGSVFVVDLNNERVLKFSPNSFASEETCFFALDREWPNLAESTRFAPLGVAIDGGLVFVSQVEPGAPIWVFDELTGAVVDRLGAGLFERAHGLSVDAEGTLWVTDVDANRVTRMTLDGDVLQEIGGPP